MSSQWLDVRLFWSTEIADALGGEPFAAGATTAAPRRTLAEHDFAKENVPPF